MPSTVIKSSSYNSRSMDMSAKSCCPCYWKVAPPSVAWIIKLDHGHLSHNDEVIERQLGRQLIHTRHVAIVCVLGERESGKSVILDALIRHLVGKDVRTFAKPDGLPVHRTDDLNIVTSVLIMTHPKLADVGVLFIDVRSRTPSSLSYLQLMKIANEFATIKLISHYKRLSPELSQMAAEGDFIHVKSGDVHWNGTKIMLSEDLLGKFCKVIQDAGYFEHTPYFRLDDRFRQSHEILKGRQNQRMLSKPRNQNSPQYMPEPGQLLACITNNSFPRRSTCFVPHAVTKPSEYPQLHTEPMATQPRPSQLQQEDDKSASQTPTISQHFEGLRIDEDEADEPNPEEPTRLEESTAPSSSSPQGCHSAQAKFSKEMKIRKSAVERQLYSVKSKRSLILKPKNMRRTGIAMLKAWISSLIDPSSPHLREKFQENPSLVTLHQMFTHGHSLPLQNYPQVAQRILDRIVLKQVDIHKPAPQNATQVSIEETERKALEEESQLFQTEFSGNAHAFGAVEYAVSMFQEILSSKLPVLMTTADQNILPSSYAAIIMKAFKSDTNGPAWKQAAEKKLKPRLDEHMKELRQANKNTMRRWDKALDSALRKCGQVYHTDMQGNLPSKTKVSPSELENHHLNAKGPTLKAFSVPTEVNSLTRTRWDAVLNAKLEEWKGGFVYLNEKKPEEPSKVAASPPVKGVNASVSKENCEFLSQWDREELEEDVKRCRAATAQTESTEDIRTAKDFEQDNSARGRLALLIQRVRDTLEDPSFEAGPTGDFLFERVELYSDVLANDCASERDLHKALLKLQAAAKGFL